MATLILFTLPTCRECDPVKDAARLAAWKLSVGLEIHDAKEARELAVRYRIHSVPALVLIDHNGEQLATTHKPRTAAQIKAWILDQL